MSLAQVFLSAGASSVLAGLWQLADERTEEPITRFYAELKTGSSKAEALQRTQIALLRNPRYRHPFYWAAFMLTGDWR